MMGCSSPSSSDPWLVLAAASRPDAEAVPSSRPAFSDLESCPRLRLESLRRHDGIIP
jgi:hypothetical protein